MELHLLIFGVCLLAYGAVGADDLKSSLTFVIDESASMYDGVLEVIKAVDAIADVVSNSSSTPIDEFVLVTFHDDVELVTKTGDKAALKGNISDINVGGGNLCPGKSLTGIERALNESKYGSLLYVFTDASAEDFNLTEKVQALSQKKGVQIVFILTGVCEEGNRTSPDYLVYHDLAKATNGQVFHLKQEDIGKLLKYVENAVESRNNIVASKTIPAGGNSFNVNVDGDTQELVIAVSGESPMVTVTCAGGEVNASNITRLQEIAVVKVAVKPGVYKVDVASRSESHVVVSANTSIHFQHGFSTIEPSAISDTARQPLPSTEDDPDVKSYLAIQLDSGGAYVELQSALILNMDDIVLLDQPLKLVHKKDYLHTTEPFVTPNDMFKIGIKGYDRKNDISVTRYALTPIKPQYNKWRAIEKKLQVSIEAGATINAEFYKPLKLICKVSAWPKPDVIWKSEPAEKVLFSKVSIIETPYEYISVLELPKITKNATYSCQATNSEGEVASNVTVQTVEKEFIEVEVEDTTIEYQKPGQIRCNAIAYPPATISWYKDHGPLKPSENLNISADGSVISIQSMEPKLAGNYYCVASNSVGNKQVKPLKVKVGGVGPPKIDKTIDQLNVAEGGDVDITCKIAATPNATRHWYFKNATTYIALNVTADTISLEYLETTQAGTYTCEAQNDYGVDYHRIELIVECEPTITKNSSEEPQRVTAVEGRMVILNCSANGVPAPNITWTHNGIAINTTRHSFYTNGSLGFPAEHSDEGSYQCEARNDLGTDATTFDLEVIISAALEAPGKSYIEQEEGTPLTLHCRADGRPTPNITWLYRISPKADIIKLSRFDLASGDLRFARIQHGQSGEYICVAENEGASKNLTYFVTVTARPSILYTMKTFRGVNEDMYLRVPCDATGNPKPEIVWTKNDINLASDTQWYLIGEDGSLIIKNISKWSEGYYTCTASNTYGRASEVFSVEVDTFPSERFLSIQIEEGKSANIPCSVPHKLTDRLRWFKDGEIVNSTELHNVTTKDAGTYTCRVSSVDRPPQSGSTEVKVGSKPRLVYDDAKTILYRYGGTAVMDCTQEGIIPTPKVSWLHDGIAIDFAESRYQFMMVSETQKGSYTCIAKNQYGYAQQDFVVSGAEADAA